MQVTLPRPRRASLGLGMESSHLVSKQVDQSHGWVTFRKLTTHRGRVLARLGSRAQRRGVLLLLLLQSRLSEEREVREGGA